MTPVCLWKDGIQSTTKGQHGTVFVAVVLQENRDKTSWFRVGLCRAWAAISCAVVVWERRGDINLNCKEKNSCELRCWESLLGSPRVHSAQVCWTCSCAGGFSSSPSWCEVNSRVWWCWRKEPKPGFRVTCWLGRVGGFAGGVQSAS